MRFLPLLFVFLSLVFLAIGITALAGPSTPDITTPPTESVSCSPGETISCECGGVRTCQNGRFGICQYDVVCSSGQSEPCFELGCYTGDKHCNECGKWSACVPVGKISA